MARQPKPAGRRTVIYGLVDPRSGEIFYVGKTSNAETRVARHLAERCNKGRVEWIRNIIGVGLKPTLAILEVVQKGENWGDREIYWIARGKELGWPLVNISEGGPGKPVYVNKTPTRRAPAPRGRK